MTFLDYVRKRIEKPGPERRLMLDALGKLRVDQLDQHPFTANKGEAGRKILRKLLGRLQHRLSQMQAQAREERRPLTEEEIGRILVLLSPDNEEPL